MRKIRVNWTLLPTTIKHLKKLAVKKGLSVSQLIDFIVAEYINQGA